LKEERLKGGEFLLKESNQHTIYVPEMITQEQEMISNSAKDFFINEVHPVLDRLDAQEEGLTLSLLEKAEKLGFLGISIPAEYGGMELDFNTETYFFEQLGIAHSFALSLGAHIGIGTLPILYFGTEAQKKKYLPMIACGKTKAAYCLTEPTSGSDALSAKTKAVLNKEGSHYILNGQKMWITNGGFSDLFTVFVQVDGSHFTAFLVDAHSKGVRLGEEEKKMGIKGSSTRQVFFENVEVPVENLLGEIGKGHRIAFNTLNIGRFKLGNGVTGGAKSMLVHALSYANERVQFNQPIGEFGAIQHKIANMAIKIYGSESAVYRTSGLIHDLVNDKIESGEKSYMAKQIAAEEYAIECAMLKVYGSEIADQIVDETLQIYGGMGYSEELPIARAYRDCRINRIYEGTNEINRLLTTGMLLKRAMGGRLDLMSSALKLQQELMKPPENKPAFDDKLEELDHLIAQAKKAWLLVAASAAQTLMDKLEKEQEIMMLIADISMDIFIAESSLLRTRLLIDKHGKDKASVLLSMTKVLVTELMQSSYQRGKEALCGFVKEDMLAMQLGGLKRLTGHKAINLIEERRKIAKAFLEKGDYYLMKEFKLK
jgi:hypothetical protein